MGKTAVDITRMCNEESISEEKILRCLNTVANTGVSTREALQYFVAESPEYYSFKKWAKEICGIEEANKACHERKYDDNIKRAVAFGKWFSFVDTLNERRELYQNVTSKFEECLAIKKLSEFYLTEIV